MLKMCKRCDSFQKHRFIFCFSNQGNRVQQRPSQKRRPVQHPASANDMGRYTQGFRLPVCQKGDKERGKGDQRGILQGTDRQRQHIGRRSRFGLPTRRKAVLVRFRPGDERGKIPVMGLIEIALICDTYDDIVIYQNLCNLCKSRIK